MFDSIRCGALLLFASDHTPLPFSDEIDYDAFALRVPEGANVNATVAAVGSIPPRGSGGWRRRGARGALLDYRDGLVDAALRHVGKGRLVVRRGTSTRARRRWRLGAGPCVRLRVERV